MARGALMVQMQRENRPVARWPQGT